MERGWVGEAVPGRALPVGRRGSGGGAARLGAGTPGKRGGAAALRGWEGRRVRGPRQVGSQEVGGSSREGSGHSASPPA